MPHDLTSLTAISPLDGRYRSQLNDVSNFSSEYALIRARLIVEIEYLLFLSDQKLIPVFSNEQQKQLRSIVEAFDEAKAAEVKTIEQTTKHDVKAVEYFLRETMKKLELPNEEFAHVALTSEDTNSLAYGLLLKNAVQEVLLPTLKKLLSELITLVEQYKGSVMLARTHGQPAIPTTFGKEMLVFAYRLFQELQLLEMVEIEAKMSGAVGNFSAHQAAFNDVDWLKLSQEFITGLGLKPTLFSTQIVQAETYSRLFGIVQRINSILIDFDQDMWRYISDGYVTQKIEKGQVGSSTMPHKVNPIDFENSEGNLGLANSMLAFFIQKLPISRLQRDLTDSTVKRSTGTALGYACLGYRSLMKGLSKIAVNEDAVQSDLNSHWEVVAEAFQVVLRVEGDSQGYEKLKTFSQGKLITEVDVKEFIKTLDVSPAIREKLSSITPVTYVGLTLEIIEQGLKEIKKYLQSN